MNETPVNQWGIAFPRLLLAPYKLTYRLGRSQSRSHSGGTGYDHVDQDLNRAIARVAEAVQYLPDRGNAGYAGRRATLTRRERELLVTVANDADRYRQARDLADELAVEARAYHRACADAYERQGAGLPAPAPEDAHVDADDEEHLDAACKADARTLSEDEVVTHGGQDPDAADCRVDEVRSVASDLSDDGLLGILDIWTDADGGVRQAVADALSHSARLRQATRAWLVDVAVATLVLDERTAVETIRQGIFRHHAGDRPRVTPHEGVDLDGLAVALRDVADAYEAHCA